MMTQQQQQQMMAAQMVQPADDSMMSDDKKADTINNVSLYLNPAAANNQAVCILIYNNPDIMR